MSLDAAAMVVLGAGLAGWTTVREFRKLDATTPVVLVTADSGDFYAKPTLSNAFAQKRGPAQLVTTPAQKMADGLNVTLLAHTGVASIDSASRLLQFGADAQGTVHPPLHYRDLVLAVGARSVRLPLQGDAASEVLWVNSLDDFRAFHQRVHGDTPRSVVIMGAGLIGCEFANDLAQAGHQVHVVDPAARALSLLLPVDASAPLQSALESAGVLFHWGTTVLSIDRAGETLRVTLANGEALAADAVLSAVGLRPDTRLAAAAGVICARGIAVDGQLRTSVEHLYALGDCAQYTSAGSQVLLYVMPIMHAAKALAANLCGTRTELVFPLMPVSVKTPALPLAILPPGSNHLGTWQAAGDGAWVFCDAQGVQRGFALAGSATARRQAMLQATIA